MERAGGDAPLGDRRPEPSGGGNPLGLLYFFPCGAAHSGRRPVCLHGTCNSATHWFGRC